MRDRLKELFKKINYVTRPNGLTANLATQFNEYSLNYIVDELLANGVIVPPCKVGDRLYYCIDLGNIVHGQVLEITVLRAEIQDKIRFYAKTVKHYRYNYTWFDSTDIGKTVFLTKEEAEKALAERSRQ